MFRPALGVVGALWMCGADTSAQDETAAAVDHAFAWLDEHVAQPDWLDVSSANARGQHVVAQSMLAWLSASRSSPTDAVDRLDLLDRRVRRVVGALTMIERPFATWLLGSTSFYLAECSLRDGSRHDALVGLAANLGSLRNSERVWSHGGMEYLGFYPSTVLAATNWATWSIGVAAAMDVAMPAEWIEDAAQLFEDVQGSRGGFGYGGRPYRIGVEAGRTAGVVIALAASGRVKSRTFEQAARYVASNIRSIPAGHASPAMHVLNGALAAYALGEETWRCYREQVSSRLLDAQQADGSFLDIVGERSPDSMSMMGDDLGRISYVTALYAAALSVPNTRVATWLRDRVGRSFAPPDHPPSVAGTVRWSIDVGSVVGLAARAERVYALLADGTLVTSSSVDGQEIARVPVPCFEDAPEPVALTWCGEDLLAWSPLGPSIACFDRSENRVRWQTSILRAVRSVVRPGKASALLVTDSGAVIELDLRDGQQRKRGRVAIGLRRGAWPLDDGAFITCADSRVVCYEPGSRRRWRGRNRTSDADVPASWTALTVGRDAFFGGSTDASLVCRSLADGSLIWREQLDSGVVQVAFQEEREDRARVLALSAGGMLTALDATSGDRIWQVDEAGGVQSPEDHPTRFRVSSDATWILATGRETLLRVDDDGVVTARIRCPGVVRFVPGRDCVFVALAGGGLRCYRSDA